MIFTPPRHSKSELVSRRLPPYIFGHYPQAEIIHASYAESLITSMSRAARTIMASQEYNEIFPDSRLSDEKSAVEEWTLQSGGVYKCAGVGGGITGRGFNFGIIDDPIKDRAEAESFRMREALFDWYTSTFFTRQYPGARILLTQTRWHEDDLSGRLIRLMKTEPGADKWVIVSLPALAPNREDRHQFDPRKVGEALWPTLFDREKLLKFKANLGNYDFSALYQQRPSPSGGSRIQRGWFEEVSAAPKGLHWVRYWDLAISKRTSANKTASAAMAKDNEDFYYIKEGVTMRKEWPDVEKRIGVQASIDNIINIGVEEAGQQKGFIDSLVRKYPMLAIRAIKSDQDKLTRALPWIAQAESGRVRVVRGPWLESFYEECQMFTGVNDREDDQIDMVSGAYSMIQSGDCGVEVF